MKIKHSIELDLKSIKEILIKSLNLPPESTVTTTLVSRSDSYGDSNWKEFSHLTVEFTKDV